MEDSIVDVVSGVAGESIVSSKKLNKLSDKKAKIIECIVSSCSIILWDFILPMMAITLIFLGSLQAIYPHESNLQDDLNASMGLMGGAFYSMYTVGVENQKWFYYFFIILGGYLYFTFDDVYRNVKRILRSGDGMSAQDIVDASDIKTLMKGGNE